MVGLVIDRESAWDIDTPLDWTITEQLLLMRRKSPEAA
jgi:CMP-N-acetylneuraminic acid synthetase